MQEWKELGRRQRQRRRARRPRPIRAVAVAASTSCASTRRRAGSSASTPAWSSRTLVTIAGSTPSPTPGADGAAARRSPETSPARGSRLRSRSATLTSKEATKSTGRSSRRGLGHRLGPSSASGSAAQAPQHVHVALRRRCAEGVARAATLAPGSSRSTQSCRPFGAATWTAVSPVASQAVSTPAPSSTNALRWGSRRPRRRWISQHVVDGVEVGPFATRHLQTGDLPVHGRPAPIPRTSRSHPRINVALLCQGFDLPYIAITGCRDERVYCGHGCRCCESLHHQCTVMGSRITKTSQTKPLSGYFFRPRTQHAVAA